MRVRFGLPLPRRKLDSMLVSYKTVRPVAAPSTSATFPASYWYLLITGVWTHWCLLPAKMAALTNADDEVELLGAALAGTEALLDRTIAQALEEADQDRAREQRVDDVAAEPPHEQKQPDEPPSQPSRALLHNVQASHDAAARHREDALQKAVAFRDDWRRRRAAAEARPPPPRPPRRRKPPESPAKDNNGIAGAQLRGVAAAGATILAGAVAGPGRRPIQMSRRWREAREALLLGCGGRERENDELSHRVDSVRLTVGT